MDRETPHGSSLKGLSAIVSGASRGIGRATAVALGSAGADICLVARTATALAELSDELAQVGVCTIIESCDITDRLRCARLTERVKSEWGKVDILVNCAGAYRSGRFLELDLDDFQSLMAVNLHGTVNMMQAALPGMIESGFGRVINVASMAGKWGSLNQSAYNASKHAVVGLTRCVALELAATGVTVNAVCPGLVRTDMFEELLTGQSQTYGISEQAAREKALSRQPIGRLLEPSEIAATIAFLASPGAGGMTGQSIQHDGGMLLI